MPPKKKYTNAVTVGLTPFEAELLQWIVAQQGGSAAHHLRRALWEHGKEVVVEGDFESQMRRRALEQPSATMAQGFNDDLDRFFAGLPDIPKQIYDSIDANLDEFASTTDDFTGGAKTMSAHQSRAALTVNLGPKERAIVAYYCAQHRETKGAVIRAIIRRFAIADRNFDPQACQSVVETELSVEESDSEAQGLIGATNEFVREREERRTAAPDAA